MMMTVTLEKAEESLSPIVRANDLEIALIMRLPVTDDDSCYFPPRNDAHWLQCAKRKRPVPSSTILGIAEEGEDEDFEKQVSVTLISCRPSNDRHENASTTSSHDCSSLGPHSDWKRKHLRIKSSILSKHRTMAWVDLRSHQEPVATSKASVVRLLRSVLTKTHEASPWNDDDTLANNDSNDIVILILSHPCEILRDFRVSDVSPSWFLHAQVPCEKLEEDFSSNQFWKKGPIRRISPSGKSGILYIYKRLGYRNLLSVQNPHSKTTASCGCLWEEYQPYQEDSEDGKRDENSSEENKYRLVCPPYINLAQCYSNSLLERLFDPKHLEIFTKEALSIPMWTPWPETQHYSVSSSKHADDPEKPWTVFPLCYCFPSDQPQNLTWVPTTTAHCPETCEVLQTACDGLLRTALFSQLAPETTLQAHTGWADLANHVLRLHIPLIVPPGDFCGTWVSST